MAKIAVVSKKTLVRRPTTAGECEEIEKLAYALFLQRGSQHGSNVGDWLKAEAIIKSRRS